VYEKGAELIGMLRRTIGNDKYREGMDLYFARHDGQAVTIEDYYACFEAVSGRDLSAFRRWYAQAGTPEVRVTEAWDPATGTIDAAGLEGVDAVIHLAGEGIGEKRCFTEQKEKIRTSRTLATALIASTLAGLQTPPKVL
jgi:hypothetical protein